MSGAWSRIAGSKLLRIVIAYPVVAWVVIEVSEVMLPRLGLPDWTVTLVVALAILGFPIALFLGWAASRDAGATSLATADRHSIAVLPFVDMSEDQDQAYFCEGMAAEIINDLVKVGRLKVASRTSSFSYRNTDLDACQIGRELNVASILEGGVRKSGRRLRVTAQLIDVNNGFHLWSERYDRELVDVFDIQDEIAHSIVRALKVRLTAEEAEAMALPVACTPEAYEYYLKGMHEFHGFGRRSLEAALKWFERSLEECDVYAPSYAGMANALAFIYMFQDANPEYSRRAGELAERAVELDPASAEAHTARGITRLLERQFEASEQSFQRALALNPELFEAHHQYARMLWTSGRADEAVREFRRATELNPDDYVSPNLMVSLLQDGQHDAEARHYAELAVTRAERWLERHPYDARALYLGSGSLIMLGRRSEAEQWAEKAITMQPTTDTFYNAACTYARLGQLERAIDLLERADMKGRNYDWMVRDPDLFALKGHPRFEKLLETLR